MPVVTQRRQDMLTGAIALLLLVALVSVGVKAAFGAYDGGYQVVGRFSAAGQGLLPGSDIKVRGVNIGSVRRIDLVDNQAVVTMTIKDGERVPTDAVARIRAKTLFGEKFVDVDLTGTDEHDGPFLAAGDEFAPGNTEGGFELEQVLADTFPLLQAIDPAELMTVMRELADAGDGLGEAINRSIANGAEIGAVFADNVDNTSAFLRDLALVSGQLADSADDILAIADAGHAALPTLNANEDALIELLQQTGRLSNDVADLLRNNQDFVDAALGPGSDVVDLLHEQRDQVVPVVVGLRQYVQTLSEIIRIEVGDGTLMGAVKAVLGADLCGVIPCGGGPGGNGPTPEAPSVGSSSTASLPVTGPGLLLDPPPAARPADEGDVGDLLRRLLGA